MKWTMHIQAGLLNLFAAKLRSLLALLGILVGTASVVAMVSGGELATKEALKQFKMLGTDLFAITINTAEQPVFDTAPTLSLPQVNAILKLDQHIVAVAPYIQLFNTLQFNGHVLGGSIVGVTESFAKIARITIEQGRFISDLDKYTTYCVIGNAIYQQIEKTTTINPIGQQLQLGKTIFTIIGVAQPWQENSFVYVDIDHAILIPLQTAFLFNKTAAINNILLQLTENTTSATIQTQLENYLSTLLPSKKFYFRSAKELIAKMAKQSEILTLFLGLIGSISLLVGGIGVMNIMLVSVMERRQEIGIRLAVGATRADIRALFLIEAIMLSVVGGLLGIVLGLVIEYMIAWFFHWEFTWFLLPPCIGFIVSVATGIFFGFYPAHQAAQLDPIQALRAE